MLVGLGSAITVHLTLSPRRVAFFHLALTTSLALYALLFNGEPSRAPTPAETSSRSLARLPNVSELEEVPVSFSSR